MKTQLQNLKNKLSSFSKAMVVGALIFISANSNAQPAGSCSALFTPFDSLGYGYFYNQSSPMNAISLWDFGDGSTGVSMGDITHPYNAIGTYYVCLTIIDSVNSCSSTYCDSIRITSGSGGGGMCLGVVNPYFAATDSLGYGVFSNVPTGTGVVYHWDFGDGTTSNVVGSTTHNYTTNGTYFVCLNVFETGGSYDSCSYCSYVTIGNPMGGTCSAYFNLVQDSTNLYNYTAYSYASSGMLYSYFWDFGDGTTSNLQYPSHTYSGSGPYVLCLTITDNASCTATYCDSLYAGRGGSGINLNVVPGTVTSINEIELIQSLENYPNPFNSLTTVSYTLSMDARVELLVVNLLGEKVALLESNTKQAGNHKIDFNADGIAEGMYLLQLKVDNKVSTKKIVISK